MNTRTMLTSIGFALLTCLVAGCAGPRLSLKNARIVTFNRTAGSINWRVDVENSASGENMFCSRSAAEGWITAQAWLAKTTDLNDRPLQPAGGLLVIPDGDSLPVGAVKSNVGIDFVPTDPRVVEGFTYLIIEVYTKKASRESGLGDPSVNTGCCRYYTSVVLPLP